ncbi:putative serine/threonine-protein kinase [Colletotrichum godetiae]|uniref:Serine/threonine-protein kinase n=1 Tax=Colletotrichum godetiae TaxID=1209918 RepID=A0AAJ0EPK1_9PEZI|nr:putative serine/threonine-protein kinase [Colletotrichum godetiae]KAK1656704.1 putative serine/threonine-protein kinase [Colletotrichum godetiae]
MKNWVETKASPATEGLQTPGNINASPLPLPPAVVAHYRKRLFCWAVRYCIIVIIVFIALLIPLVTLSNDADFAEDSTSQAIQDKQYRNLVYYISLWLEVTWVAAVIFDCLGLGLPYIFRFIARYINSSHQRYWRILKFMRRPICFLGTTIVTFIFFAACINTNELLAVNVNKDPNTFAWDDVVADILEQATLWVAFYFVEKLLISYISVHYHYRANHSKLTRTKDIQNALITLFDASTYLHPVHCGTFDEEDMVIRNANGGSHKQQRTRVSSYLARLGLDGYKLVGLFGNFISDDPNAHWMRPASTYAIIERAWGNQDSASALARRIWFSCVAQDKSSLTLNDIKEILGPHRAPEATKIFTTLTEGQSHDIRLEEFTAITLEAGKTRQDIYRNINNMDHCINTFDWFCLFIIAAVMIFFIMIAYVPAMKEIQSVLSSLAIGLSFAVGRTFHHLLVGIVFVFFDHPYDIGDVINVSNAGATTGVACVVKRQSLLYTVFRRLDNNCDLQISNEQLTQKRVENYTRSGINRQGLSLFVDFRTSFADIMRLRGRLEEFLAQNSRDYVPETLGLNVASLHELNKMELRIAFTHRNNWSDDKLRSQRSNRFHCALVSACRSIPLYKPGGMSPSAGENGNPMYTVQLDTSNELQENIKKEQARRHGLRWDYVDQDASQVKAGEHSNDTRDLGSGEKTKTAKAKEQEAFLRLARLPIGNEEIGASTSVDLPGSVTGLRQSSRPLV